MTSVYLSYQAASSTLAQRIASELQTRGVIVLPRPVEEPGVTFPVSLHSTLEQADSFICVVADTTFASEWVQREVELAHRLAKPMIPVFQESYTPVASASLTPAIKALLACDGIQVY